MTLVTSLVPSRMDYGNTTLAGIPQHLLRRLQSVMNAVVRLIYSLSRFDQITPHLRLLHWLKANDRIDFKLAVLVFKCVHASAPPYLADEISCLSDSQIRCRLLCIVIYTGRPSNSPYDCGRSVISGRSVTCIEQSSTARHLVTFPSSLYTLSEDSLLFFFFSLSLP